MRRTARAVGRGATREHDLTFHVADRDLARRMLAGDERAFAEFFHTHFPALCRFTLARVHADRDAAEEIVQSTLCRAITKLATYRGESALLTWLCTFCRHEIAAFYERELRRPAQAELVEDRAEVDAALGTLAVLAGGPEDALRRKETARLVHVVLDRLPNRYADALEWKYIDGASVSEIAARLGVSTKAAESILSRARAAFRDGFRGLPGLDGACCAGAEP